MKKKGLGAAGFYMLMLLVFVVVAWMFSTRTPSVKVNYSDVVSYFQNGQVKEFVIEENILKYTLADGSTNKYTLYDVGLFFTDTREYINEQRQAGTLKYNLVPPVSYPAWLSFLPWIIAIIFFVVFFIFMSSQMGGGGKAMNFGKSRAKLASGEKNKITFADVAGVDEEKEELEEIVDFLKNPRKYIELGARIPKGVLLVGPPGTGKTLLAKAVAGEAGVPFFSISGSDFVELYVGVGASRVRDLFDQAKKNSPCIVFIDEIDAVGRQRGAGLGGGHDEREQTLNQLLVEMDGFGINEGVIVIAATNRADILDNALLRPGRFDRQVIVDVPDIKGREEILKVHARNKILDKNIDFKVIAKGTPGFTGADLENVLNEAALLAARRKKKSISTSDVEDAIMKVTTGVEKKTRVVSEKERRLTAYHEAGHAIVGRFLTHHDPVHQISIIPRGRAGGYTLFLPQDDKRFVSKNEMLDHIVSFLGGRVAEKLVLDDISNGASNDIERATGIAKTMVTKYGMSDKLGPIFLGSSHDEVFLGRDFTTQRNFSETTATQIDEEIKSIIENCYKKAESILTEQMDKLHEVANILLEKEKIDGKEFEALFAEKADVPSEETETTESENKE